MDETNPEVVAEPNVEADGVANPQGSETVVQHEADAVAHEESAELTPERIQQLLEQDRLLKEANITDPKALYSDYTRKSQRAAELERAQEDWQQREQQYRGAIDGFVGRQQAQQDPEAAAWAEYQQKSAEYDTEGALEAQRRYMNIRDQRLKQETIRDVFDAQRVERGIDELSFLGNGDANKVAQTQRNMGSRDATEATMLWEAYKRGDLREKLNAQAENEDAARAKRGRIDSFLGEGSPGAVPGSADASNRQQPVTMFDFLGLAPAARKRLYGVTEWNQLKQ